MAGESPDFDPDGFRADIEAAMTMGLPKELALRPTFYWDDRVLLPVASLDGDAAGKPWDLNAPAPAPDPDAPAPRAPVQVPCAVEYGSSPAEEGTAVGNLNANQARLTFLDIHYELIVGFSWCTLGGNRYKHVLEQPVGLYDVTVRQVVVEAVDES